MRIRVSTIFPLLCTSALIAQSQPASKPAVQPASKPVVKKPLKPYPKVLIKTSMGNLEIELFENEAPKTVANFIGLAEGSKEFTDPKTKEKTKRPFYDGLVFHRIIKGFMAQGGCPLGTGSGSPGYKFEDEINAKALELDKAMAMVGQQPNKALLIRDQRQFGFMVLRPLFEKLGIKSQEDLDKRKGDVDKALKTLTVMQVYEGLGYKYDDSRPSHGMLRGTIAMANSGPNTNGSQFFINMVDNKYLNGKHTVFGRVVKGMEVVDKMAQVEMVGAGPQPSTPKEAIKILSIRKIVAEKKDAKKGAANAKKDAAKDGK